ncbi:hypothetical protein Vretimale_10343 [Volvox reticuliferus]|uniref:Nucleotide-diphospho-sugar transferase domain-containing protein n=1 Tax=Volvox reticuliferus TaxID=1737510 RepID=A0A8J4GEB8_9CHLO|nr:hypothetical protein Vretifemale_12310 [Volvox reticuliferus]GIM05922.1 hypothetical protein Vretimale_10343 [Volvox reticuliferus]
MLQTGLATVERAAPVPVTSRTDRLMARIALVIVAGGLVYGFYSLGGPIYWKVYATVIHPYQDKLHPSQQAPVSAAPAPQLQAVTGKGGSGVALSDGKGGGGGTTQPKEEPKQEPKQEPKVLPKVDPSPSPPPPPSPSPPPSPVPPPSPKAFNPDDYPLTRERVIPLLQDGLIMITWANHHYLDFAKTWVYNLKKSGVSGYMVGAMDDDMLKDLVELKFNCWRMNTGITKRDLGWGSQNFHLMGRFKIKLIRDVLALDVTVVVSDIDTAWLKNPIPYFHRYPEADILTSTDQLSPTVKDDSLEQFPHAGSAFNIGIMLFRPKSKEFVDEWVKALDDPRMWDQTAFNDLARKGHGHSEPPKNLWLGYDGKLRVGVLPCALFASGHTFFVQHKYRELGLEPYVAHATFQYSGTPGKRHRFREEMLFDDPPEYYNHPRGFVAIDMDIPQELLDRAAMPVEGAMTGDKLADHFALVHHQLFRLRAAVAVAVMTGRVVVLPPIWCQLDKYWAPLYNGNIPGTEWKKPFICPADHVLDLEGGWYPQRPEFGPHLEYREYSFFNNPRMTKAVNDSRVTVVICNPGEADCSNGDAPAQVKNGVVRLAQYMNSDQINKALEGVRDYKIITLRNAAAAFKEFSEPEKQQQYVNRMNHYASVFCCLSENPGWIWYDFFADRPHYDRFHREFGGQWTPKHGDTSKNVAGYQPAKPLANAGAATHRRGLLEALLASRALHRQDRDVAITDDISTAQRDQEVHQGGVVLHTGVGPEALEQQLAIGLPRRLQSEREKLEDVRFLSAMELNAMYSAP